MRTLLALVLVVLGCGASGPSGPVSGDAGADTSDALVCPRGTIRVDGPRCASYTDSNCDGRACPAGQHCLAIGTDQGDSVACGAQ